MAYETMYQVRQSPYYVNNNMRFVKSKKENEDATNSSRSSRPDQEELQTNPNERKAPSLHQQLIESKEANRLAIASRDANLKNATINIAQILKDFKSTAKAIGASPELMEEVNTYLALVEKQVVKENPDTKLVRSNLKNASTLLDNYITETLQRPSKVVENWLDALFLQQINYRFNEEEINAHFLVKFPDSKKDEEGRDSSKDDGDSEEDNDDNKQKQHKKQIVVPEDEKLKTLFIQAKKYLYANDTKMAMQIFKTALDRAIEVQDKETESKILFEIGKIYDRNDFLVQALTSYNKSILATQDMSVKTKAHYSMAQIYDDVAQFEPAIKHYMSSISYAGENENLTAQSTSLTKIGSIYSDKYERAAFDFLTEAEIIAKESKNSKAKGYVSSTLANTYSKFNEPQNALKQYSNAIKEFQDAKSPLKVAINYKRAADLMKDYNNPQKAKALMQKALFNARQTDDVQLMKEIHDALNLI